MYQEYINCKNIFLTKTHNYHVNLINKLPNNPYYLIDYIGQNKWVFDHYMNR